MKRYSDEERYEEGERWNSVSIKSYVQTTGLHSSKYSALLYSSTKLLDARTVVKGGQV
jgi:hypothetical protein